MNKKNISIFIVDDHPSMIEGYKSILSFNNLGYTIEVTPAYNCETAYKRMEESNDIYEFDMIFLDLSLPPYLEKNIHSGQDLAVLAKEKYPNAKILILTSHAEAFVLFDIKNKIEPDGLLVKSDFTAEEFLSAFETVLNNGKYVSKTVEENIAELLLSKTFLDPHIRKIITLLASGIQTKSLPNFIDLSMSSIDKRKVLIKEAFQIKSGTDEDIIREAKKHGFV
uniref:response regulator n=1 Tax=Flavobacterium sp. TaxID=239 RepID=UPI00404A96CC